MGESITVSPAYGRDYRTAEHVCIDWQTGKDFYLHAIDGRPYGCYCSTRDFPGGTEVNIRYDGKREKVTFVQR